MATPPIHLEDFTCTICREIFKNPVSLSCLHCYCQECLNGLKKSPSSDMEPIPVETSSIHKSLIYKPKTYEPNQCYGCAICRKDSFGYTECRDIEADLKTLEALCPYCLKSFIICDLRKHIELCSSKRKIGVSDVLKAFNPNIMKKLSQPQAAALQKARAGENRSTFQCPYCPLANFTVEHLCLHIEEKHLDDNHYRVCTICAAMPWGNPNRASPNVYEHIYNRHRFNYDTYVNFEQDEATMVAEAIEKSLLFN